MPTYRMALLTPAEVAEAAKCYCFHGPKALRALLYTANISMAGGLGVELVGAGNLLDAMSTWNVPGSAWTQLGAQLGIAGNDSFSYDGFPGTSDAEIQVSIAAGSYTVSFDITTTLGTFAIRVDGVNLYVSTNGETGHFSYDVSPTTTLELYINTDDGTGTDTLVPVLMDNVSIRSSSGGGTVLTVPEIVEGSKCYCMSDDQAMAAILYILNTTQNAVALTPDQIQTASKCYCLNKPQLVQAIIYAMNIDTSDVGMDVGEIVDGSKCYCVKNNGLWQAILYVINTDLEATPLTPAQLAEAAKCYCMDEESLLKGILYMLLVVYEAGGFTFP